MVYQAQYGIIDVIDLLFLGGILSIPRGVAIFFWCIIIFFVTLKLKRKVGWV